MKPEKMSIKWRIFSYLLVFTGILLIVLWLIQICYLDFFYKKIKSNQAEQITNEAIHILKSTKDETKTAQALDDLALESNTAIMVTDASGEICYNAEYIATSRLNTMPEVEIADYYNRAYENGGTIKIEYQGSKNKTYPRRNILFPELPADNPSGDNALGDEPVKESAMEAEGNAEGEFRREPLKPDENGGGTDVKEQFIQNLGQDMAESVIYVNIVNTENEEYLLFVNTQLTPVDATVETLRIELVWLTCIMIVLSMAIALLISRQISKSFIKINDSAKEMAKGNFDVAFEGKDYKEIAELSKTLNVMAEELNKNEKFRQDLIANVSHDLRTPLTMIIAYAEVMRDLPGENSPENVQVVIDEAQRLTNLVNDMLDISKLQAGVMNMDITEYNLTESIESVFARYNKLNEQDGYTINFEYGEKVAIRADEYKIFQVIYNLVNNAINYTGESKTVIIRQRILGDVVRIEVIDDGEGIAPEALQYVWNRYYKVDKTHKRALMGTGLGLSIVKNILELHQAKYGVESELGKGSVFWFELKYEKVEAV